MSEALKPASEYWVSDSVLASTYQIDLKKVIEWVSGRRLDEVLKDYLKHKKEFPELHE